jgi:hypothetical protein
MRTEKRGACDCLAVDCDREGTHRKIKTTKDFAKSHSNPVGIQAFPTINKFLVLVDCRWCGSTLSIRAESMEDAEKILHHMWEAAI